ncbi:MULTISPECIES: DNA internalization-related competence protein ComEC/Rec2 [Thiorhodovibrio]|uniref:DNA internalization-related competence protein ComEC/Rec2 n=1 Tax=Thiorhodovibrio TaxID=61593 RepID=UPI001F5D80AA|nr:MULTISPECIES: DNA internalization-related competence protein ComEC/Rec2 [Thiorhodovibrio]WPL12870.1 ComEC family competence protein [Thiorhodovibrio litoralis]
MIIPTKPRDQAQSLAFSRLIPGGLPATALAFALGAGGFFLQDHLAPAPLLLGSCAVLALAGMRWRWPRLLLLVLVGFAHAQWASCPLLCQPFDESLLRQDLLIQGRVAGLPDQTSERARFLFHIERASRQLDAEQQPESPSTSEPLELPEQVRLSWYKGAPQIKAGERWSLLVRLKPPHGFVNPAGFDYERWLFQQGIGATGYVRDSDQNRRLDAGPGDQWLNHLRQQLRARIIAVLGETRAAALVRALVLGDREGLTPPDWQVLTRTGTNHLLAISGLHIGLIATAAFFLTRGFWARAGSLPLWLAAPRAGAVMAMLAALGYSALAGFAVSTQRALAMLAVVLVALIAGRTLRPFAALSLALLAVLLVDPLAMLSYGFWLSFGAVSALLYALGGRLGQPSLFAGWSRAQWTVALGLLPLLLLLFGRASLIAPPVNLIAVPLFSVLLPAILLATLISLASSWTLPLTLIGAGLEHGLNLLATLAELPWATIGLGERPLWVWGAAFAGVALLLAPRGLPGRWLGLIYLLPLLLVRPLPPAPGTAAVTVLDVGQGLAVVIRTARHTLVYDLGPRFPSGFNTGTAVVAPYLRALGIGEVDLLVVSHADQDHAGGLSGLLEENPVARLLSGEPAELESALSSGVTAEPCQAGQQWHWDGVELAILHPSAATQLEGNDSSCVLKITTGGASLLLSGDAGNRIEAGLVREYGQALRAEVLVAGHHGSATSSARVFLEQVDPRWVIYSAGFANRYGFPAKVVSERVDHLGIPSLNTATTGAISFLLPARPPLGPPELARAQRDRLWRHHPAP